jgi:hypothetical protein
MSEGADSAGGSEKDWQIYPIIPTIVGESTAKAREGAAWVIMFYLKLMGPIYRNVLIRYGYKTEVERIMEANEGRKTSIVPPEAEVLLDQFILDPRRGPG